MPNALLITPPGRATPRAGEPSRSPLRHPQPRRAGIQALVREYLGDARRADRSVLPSGTTPSDEDDVYRTAGFRGPHRLELTRSSVRRTVEDVRASVCSTSGADLDAFDAAPRPARRRLPRRLFRSSSLAPGPMCATHTASGPDSRARPTRDAECRPSVTVSRPVRGATLQALTVGTRSAPPARRPSTPRTRARSCAGTAPRPTTRPA